MAFKIDRMAKEISKEISLIIQNKLNNPDVAAFTTVSDVIISKDIKYATVYVLVPTGNDVKKTIKALAHSAGFIRHELSVTMQDLRTVPALRFKEDGSEAYGQKIDNILRNIKHGEEE